MKLKVLGCAGGIGGRERYTTCFRLDDDILLDAGTGLSSLTLDELVRIDHVFITHCHLDHVAGLALLLDAVQGKRRSPVIVHATRHVIEVLRKHLFNWALWPDFTRIPNDADPVMRWEPIEPGGSVDLGERRITAHTVNHTVGSAAYAVCNSRSGFLFSGDMCATPGLWPALAQEPKLCKVIVDCSFANIDCALADMSMHFCPQSLIRDIRDVASSVEFLIYHLKPGLEDVIMQELRDDGGARRFTALAREDVFQF